MEKYSSGLVSQSFWFIEFKKILKLLYEGKNWDHISELCFQENLLCISKESRARRVYGYLKNRIQVLDSTLIEIFNNTDLKTQKIINIIAIAKQNRLFYEFLYEVYRDRIIIGAIEISDSDINSFFSDKQAQNVEMGEWQLVTLRRLRGSYTNFLLESNMLTLDGKEKKITPPILDNSLESYLVDNDIQMLKAIKGLK